MMGSSAYVLVVEKAFELRSLGSEENLLKEPVYVHAVGVDAVLVAPAAHATACAIRA